MSDKTISKALGYLNLIRSALEIYAQDNAGAFPGSLRELVPCYIKSIPELEIAGLRLTSESARIDSENSGIEEVLKDSGGWVYFSNPRNPNYGKVLIDCSITAHGRKLCEH